MKQIKTSSGFEATVDETKVDDLAFLDLLCELEDGNIRAYRKIMHRMLTQDDEERLLDHIRTKDGREPISALNAELTDIIAALGKNNCSGGILARWQG